jgi:hypothetical protein
VADMEACTASAPEVDHRACCRKLTLTEVDHAHGADSGGTSACQLVASCTWDPRDSWWVGQSERLQTVGVAWVSWQVG